MPRPVVQWVGALLGVIALTSFTMGVINAPERGGRLPGERIAGKAAGPATAIVAPEATPLSQERIEGPPPPAEKPAAKTEEADQDAAAEAATNTQAAGPVLTLPPTTSATPPEDANPQPPPEDEPPH